MSLHERLYQWTARQGLDASSARRLRAFSGIDDPPTNPWLWLRRGTGALAAGLVGFGLILWIAANWGELGRLMRFALIEVLFIASLAGAAFRVEALTHGEGVRSGRRVVSPTGEHKN